MSSLPTLTLLTTRATLALLLVFMLSFCIRSWHQAHRVLALSLSTGVSASTLIIQLLCLLLYYLTPYTEDAHASAVPVLVDILCGIAWVVALALLGICKSALYKPDSGDPEEWHACNDANGWNSQYEDGYSSEKPSNPEILWCRFDVYGRQMWVVNDGAQRQLDRFMGFSAVALVLMTLVLGSSLWQLFRVRERRTNQVRTRQTEERHHHDRGYARHYW